QEVLAQEVLAQEVLAQEVLAQEDTLKLLVWSVFKNNKVIVACLFSKSKLLALDNYLSLAISSAKKAYYLEGLTAPTLTKLFLLTL
ncbi:hypothetical protein, partial [Lactobacillus sp.]|uniref:hypothetical protein n=1 Tax=Lactobacillus sp. TaxID=1591 RepID=UPI003EFAB925